MRLFSHDSGTIQKKNRPIQKLDRPMNSSDWTRTSDLAVNSRSLYQLSYGGS